jgi:hypothetical protein
MAKQLPVLAMVTGYARWACAVLVPSRRAEDFFAGWWQLIAGLGMAYAMMQAQETASYCEVLARRLRGFQDPRTAGGCGGIGAT